MKKIVSILMDVVAFIFVLTGLAYGMVSTLDNEVEVEGILSYQSIGRFTGLLHDWQYAQGRAQADFKLLYHFMGERGTLKPFFIFDQIDFRAIVRGDYDNVYHLTSAFGAEHNPPFFTEDRERNLEREIDLREAYADIFAGPLSIRVGKQQIVWGKTDIFRLLDIINPLNESWHFIFESFDDLRIPQRMVKGTLSLGNIAFIKDLSLEFNINPSDFNSNNIGIFGEPWALAPPGFQFFHRFLPDGPQFGGRIQARIGGFSFTINDYYGFQQDPIFDFQKGGLVYPRYNVVGGAVDYADEFTKSVLRLELTYSPNKGMGIDTTSTHFFSLLTRFPNGVIKEPELKYCLGIDRPTWIRFLNPTSTFLLSAQVFTTDILKYRKGVTDDGNPIQKEHTLVTFLTNTNYLHGKLTPQLAFAYDMQAPGYIMMPSIEYLITDHWRVKLGANIIWGEEGRFGSFANFRDNKEIYGKVTFSF